MRTLKEAEITINGRQLSQTQAGALRLALQFARQDLLRMPGDDIFAVGLRAKVDDMLALIDETKVEI